MTMHGYNFTERVRRTLAVAREVAQEMHHEYVGTEHFAIAVARGDEGVAAAVLQNLGAKSEDIIARVTAAVSPGHPERRIGPDLPYTSRAKKALELSMA